MPSRCVPRAVGFGAVVQGEALTAVGARVATASVHSRGFLAGYLDSPWIVSAAADRFGC